MQCYFFVGRLVGGPDGWLVSLAGWSANVDRLVGRLISLIVSVSQGFKGGREGKGETRSGKKGGGRGRKLLNTEHLSIEEKTPLARCETEGLV